MKSVQYCAASAAPVDPAIHRHIRLRRLGLQGATARLIAEHAFGQARDELVLVAAAGSSTMVGGVRR